MQLYGDQLFRAMMMGHAHIVSIGYVSKRPQWWADAKAWVQENARHDFTISPFMDGRGQVEGRVIFVDQNDAFEFKMRWV